MRRNFGLSCCKVFHLACTKGTQLIPSVNRCYASFNGVDNVMGDNITKISSKSTNVRMWNDLKRHWFLVLLFIGWKTGTQFFSQSPRVALQSALYLPVCHPLTKTCETANSSHTWTTEWTGKIFTPLIYFTASYMHLSSPSDLSWTVQRCKMQFKQKMSEKKSTWNSTQKHDVIVSDMGEKKGAILIRHHEAYTKKPNPLFTLIMGWRFKQQLHNIFKVADP